MRNTRKTTTRKTAERKTTTRRSVRVKLPPEDEAPTLDKALAQRRRMKVERTEGELSGATDLKKLALKTLEDILLNSSQERNRIDAAKSVLTLARAEEEAVRIALEEPVEVPVRQARATFANPAPVRVLPRRRRKGKKEEELEVAESLVAEGKFSIPSAPGH